MDNNNFKNAIHIKTKIMYSTGMLISKTAIKLPLIK